MSPAGPSKTEPAIRSKLVIRRLPPNLPENIFWTSVEPWVHAETCLWKRFVPGKAGDGRDQRPVFSRAYVLMASPEALVNFHRGFDGHLFRSKTGEEYQAVVEFSPVQKTPYKAKVKTDARQGTIEEDPDYKSYLDSLSAPPTAPAEEVSKPSGSAPVPTSTPLLDHLRALKKAKKKKDPSVKEAALSAVTKAAAKRAPQQPNVVMVAGPGRDVKVAPAEEGKKKNKKKAKGEAAGSGPKDAAKGSKQQQDAAAPPPSISRSTAPAKEKAQQDPSAQPARGLTKASNDATNPPREAGARGRGRGRGQGQVHEGSGRSARGAVMEILSKNAEGEKGGGRGGRSRGRGRGTPSSTVAAPGPARGEEASASETSLAARQERIDA